MRTWLNLGLARLEKHWGRYPDWINAYVAAQTPLAVQRQTIGEARFVVFDTETTGLDPHKDKIISVGAVCLQGWTVRVADTFEVYVRQAVMGERDAVLVHGLLQRDLADGLDEVDLLRQWLGYAGGDVLVGHHVWFDREIMSHTMRARGYCPLLNRCLDTLHLARRLETNRAQVEEVKPGDYTLEALCQRYHVPVYARHTAAGDAMMTALLLAKLLRRAQDRGLRTVGDLC